MGFKRLIKSIKESLSLNKDDLKKSSKEKSMKIILEKLQKRKKKVKKNLKTDVTNKEKKDLKEQLLILKFQIKKVEKLLSKSKNK